VRGGLARHKEDCYPTFPVAGAKDGVCGLTSTGNYSVMAKDDVHVVPGENGWRVESAADGRARSVHRTQAKAREAPREIARRNKRELLLHGRDGRIRERNSYRIDPGRSRG
jgi:Uncharacterized protein conserved in bacteria (DUF2188)